MPDAPINLAELVRLAEAERGYGPWLCTDFSKLVAHEIHYCRAVSPDVVLRLIAALRHLENVPLDIHKDWEDALLDCGLTDSAQEGTCHE